MYWRSEVTRWPLHVCIPLCFLSQPGEPRVAVILTDIDEDGIVTVQVCGPGVNQLQRLMTLINDKYKVSRCYYVSL